ncbi:Uncharacterised protein [Shigella sonnei]|nr:Uncharacterised protein [Shigella sonnei]CSE79936.1 Uncharacterised protein [Shigella sonnei]CSF30249.1 Uncharacterised protein [Shigella sonnei]CSF63879.1 Uncharacterised protein [Shigella sonnei]CSP52112.1 Uncharacterised protein [Shigella sonnei]
MGDPANGTCHCENDGEHGRRNTHRFQDDTRVEIDVRVQFLLDKVRVVQRDVFQLHSHFQQVIFGAQLFQNFMAGFTHYGGARVVIFVHAVTEAHQAERIIFIFRTTNKFRNVFNGANFFQHFQRRFVSTTVRRSPQ